MQRTGSIAVIIFICNAARADFVLERDGVGYSGRLPKQLYILNPLSLQAESLRIGGVHDELLNRGRRWFYQHGNGEQVPILSDELIHFRDWNPLRGVNPLVSLAPELEQDYYATAASGCLTVGGSASE
ncbi:MAG: hypothetical protein LBH43_10815 [Treponema sp.]|nr:hypothetical protein [Treponema sp.]